MLSVRLFVLWGCSNICETEYTYTNKLFPEICSTSYQLFSSKSFDFFTLLNSSASFNFSITNCLPTNITIQFLYEFAI